MRAVFHVGTYKTGTTSFQNRLYSNRDALLKKGIFYPKACAIDDPRLGYRHAKLVYDHLDLQKDVFPINLRKAIASHEFETMILSAEAWSKAYHLHLLSRLVGDLKDAGFTRIECVVVLRNVSDYAQRLYRSFTISHGNTLPFRKYVHAESGTLDYMFMLGTLHSIFGDGLHVINYDTQIDSTEAVMRAISKDLVGLPELKRQNVTEKGALLAEFALLSNRRGHSIDARTAAFQRFCQEAPDLFALDWTERVKNDLPRPSESYVRGLAKRARLPVSEARALATPKPITAPHVSKIAKLARRLLAEETGALQKTPKIAAAG